jgi:hypothetical protein
MSGKKAGGGSKVVGALAGAGAAFVARKVIVFGWKKVTGKEPPEHPEDPEIALTEALVWGVVMGAAVSVARTLALRATSRGSAGAHREGHPPV